MENWIGLLAALGVGIPLLVVAVWLDVRRRRRAEGPPERSKVTRYVTASAVAEMPAPKGAWAEPKPTDEVLPFGYAHPGFANSWGQAELCDANVLLLDGIGATMRELMIPISRHKPLVIAAKDFTPSVLDTLVANYKALHLPVIAVTTDKMGEVAELTGAVPVSVADIRAGYLPAENLGYTKHWASDARTTRIAPREG